MLTTILITAAVATPVGYLVGALIAGSKVVDAERRYDDLNEKHQVLEKDFFVATHQRASAVADAQELRTRLDRLTDRDERGRFVRREQEIAEGVRPKAGRFKL